jgi:solute carrier family 25 uncoupling protein 8/9
MIYLLHLQVRFQAQIKPDVQLCPDPKPGTWMTYKTIFTQEGIAGLWRGALPNMGRNAIVNVAEIVCYDLVKEKIIKSGLLEDNIPAHFSSAVVSGKLKITLIHSVVDYEL